MIFEVLIFIDTGKGWSSEMLERRGFDRVHRSFVLYEEKKAPFSSNINEVVLAKERSSNEPKLKVVWVDPDNELAVVVFEGCERLSMKNDVCS